MRPYLAVLKDSFREALASRVLWILLVVATLVLGLLAPSGFKEQPLNVEIPEAAGADGSPDVQKSTPKEQTGIALTYFNLAAEPLPITREQALEQIKTWIAKIIDYFVGILGVLAATVVTSPIMPNIFEPGAIDLLLSKPISRSLLFLTKFFGGCAFIAVNAAYFIGGLWLIAGLRFGIWSPRIFLAVPVLLFLFSIYYSVSSLVGVVWRNAIVAVVVTVLFWALCFSLWGARTVMETTIPEPIVRLIPAGSALLGVTDQSSVREWHPEDSTWREVFVAEGRPPGPARFLSQPLIGPVYDAKHDRILAIDAVSRSGFFQAAAPLLIGKAAEGWKRTRGPPAPLGTLALFVRPGGEVVALTKGAVYRLVEKETAAGDKKSEKSSFVRSGPDPAVRLETSASAAMNPDTGDLAIFNRGSVLLLAREESGEYRRKIDKEVVSAKEGGAGVIAFGGRSVVLALSDGRVLVMDSADLTTREELRPQGASAPRFAAASPGGRWLSLLFHNRRFWLYNTQNRRPAGFSFSGQGDVSAAAFAGPNELWLADRAVRTTEYELDPFQVRRQQAPAMGAWEISYRYVLLPVYTIFPKPGELGNVVSYLLADEEKGVAAQFRQDLSQRREKVEVAGPIWSSLAFIVVVLGLTCLYIARSDF